MPAAALILGEYRGAKNTRLLREFGLEYVRLYSSSIVSFMHHIQ